MVFLSSRISPLTSTVIFLDRSPLATAVVTSAMLRTWPVRLPAMELTLSVRSFQVPATPLTSAWPPSFPSVPTSRATRVTSEANEPSWSTMVFTVVPMRRNSPCRGVPSCSSGIRCERSPLATAPMTRATSSVGRTRSPVSVLIDSIRSAQAPVAAPTWARCVIRPSLPIDRDDPGGFAGVVLQQVGEVVERLGDRGPQDGVLHRQADAEIALLEGLQRRQQSFGVELSVRRGGRGPGRYRLAWRLHSRRSPSVASPSGISTEVVRRMDQNRGPANAAPDRQS